VLDLVQERLTLLHQKYNHYFFTNGTQQCGWIRNLFSDNAEMSTQELPLRVRKNILELRNDRTLRLSSAVFHLINFGFVLKRYIREFRKWLLNFFFSFALHGVLV